MKIQLKRYHYLLFGLLILLIIFGIYRFFPPLVDGTQSEPSPTKGTIPDPAYEEFYPRVTAPISLTFPADLGAHPDYLTEWWYYTGNVSSTEGRLFGYQLTFFRRALLPPDLRLDRKSQWATEQVYLAHLALSDIDSGRFIYSERISREAIGLAGAQSMPYKVWLYDWKIENTGSNVYQLTASTDNLKLSLLLEDIKGITLQGDQGYSRKGAQAGNASIYFSQTRLLTTGEIEIDGMPYSVNGTSWMDHEFSTSALSEDQAGWDWFALQLDNGSEIMVYTIRKSDGEIDPYSSGKIIYPDGSSLNLSVDQFEIQVLDTWQSPHSEAVYPAKWIISVPEEDIELSITPLIADQELNLSYVYWEGAVRITGIFSGVSVEGRGYVELTGYAGPFGGDF